MRAIEIVTETPYLNMEELPYKALSSISVNRIKGSFDLIGKIDNFEVYQNRGNHGIVSGQFVDGEFYVATMITTRLVVYPVEPTQLTDILQVAMVNVSTEFAEMGLTARLYSLIGQARDLVSNQEQYLGARGLWKSLARHSDVSVYVFDGALGDYERDSNGVVIKYNGKNINDHLIWGQSELHRMKLLVATSKELI